ncbi:unnamed protein product [Tuber aestivum]|uniref:Uncharacterized protein n=1 Tax=Tuber aestivum TaxID=59557 RepID=A0A292Q4H7_9PEZI|nr:unnamed protein product [Tuber aestivum]
MASLILPGGDAARAWGGRSGVESQSQKKSVVYTSTALHYRQYMHNTKVPPPLSQSGSLLSPPTSSGEHGFPSWIGDFAGRGLTPAYSRMDVTDIVSQGSAGVMTICFVFPFSFTVVFSSNIHVCR